MLRKALVANTQRLSCGLSPAAVRTAPAFLSLRPSAATAVATAPAVTTNQHRRHYHEKDDRPRNVGSMSKTDADVGTGLVGAPACGDVMKLQIRVDAKDQRIRDVKFKTFGCGSAIASSSYLTELVRGMTLEEAGRVRNTEIARELCLPPVKLHCSMLAEDAIKSAISNYYSKNPQAQRQATDLSSTPAASLNKSAAPASEVAGSDAVAAVSASSSMSPATASNTATA